MVNWREIAGRKLETEGWSKTVELVNRNEAESVDIVEAALNYSDGSLAGAKKMLNKVAVMEYGAAWGQSFFVAEAGVALVEATEVVRRMIEIHNFSEREWHLALATRTARQVMLSPYDLALYMAQVDDLGGEPVTMYFRRMLGQVENSLAQTLLNKGRSLYERMAGLSYWEMPAGALTEIMLSAYMGWEHGLETYETVEEKYQESVRNILVEARSRLRKMAKALICRRIITAGKQISVSTGTEIDYEDLLGLLD